MIVLLSGPEKVGKTTLAREIVRQSRALGVHAIHGGMRRPEPFSVDGFLEMVKLGCRTDMLVVMDRGWPDEVAYTKLLQRASPIKSERWVEWCLGDVMRTCGTGYMLVPGARREELDDSDIKVDYQAEREEFVRYGEAWGYEIVNDWSPEQLAGQIIQGQVADKRFMETNPGLLPPEYVGHPAPDILLVGEDRNENSRDPGAWAAMTSRYFRQVAALLPGDMARTNADCLQVPAIRNVAMGTKRVVALGAAAGAALRDIDKMDFVELRHPSYVYRWNKDVEQYEQQVVQALGEGGDK